MKTIGIVGGIAWPSSIVYYRIIKRTGRPAVG
jgi:aspartate/glutamate racemase